MKNNKFFRLMIKYLAVILGSGIYAAGFRFILFPNSITTGGIGGIAMIINHFTEWPIGVMIIIMNIPLFLIAAKKLGFVFVLSSAVGMAGMSIIIDILSLVDFVITTEPFLVCIYGGVLTGAGLGLVYRMGATTGGTDIIAKLIRKRYPFVNLGTALLMLDVIVVCSGAIVFNNFGKALYAFVTMFISSKVIDLVLYGMDIAKLCLIITDESEAVKDFVFKTLDRGVTFINGQGGYSGADKRIVMCAIRPRQIVELRAAIKTIDPNAFTIITDAKEVFGQGFSDITEVK